MADRLLVTPSTDLLALTAWLVDIPSVSHHEQQIVATIEAELRSIPWLETVRVGDNLVARTNLGRRYRVILGGHTDTVPVNGDNGVSSSDGATVWGVGSADMKGGLAVMLELARTVVGRNQIKRMPSPAACFAAAAVFLAMAIWPLWQTGQLTSPLSDVMTLALGWGWFIGLGVRGGVGYARDWRRLMSEEPFATRDRWLYSPLCFALAGIFFLLLKSGMSR